jgi:hypothetical protein
MWVNKRWSYTRISGLFLADLHSDVNTSCTFSAGNITQIFPNHSNKEFILQIAYTVCDEASTQKTKPDIKFRKIYFPVNIIFGLTENFIKMSGKTYLCSVNSFILSSDFLNNKKHYSPNIGYTCIYGFVIY